MAVVAIVDNIVAKTYGSAVWSRSTLEEHGATRTSVRAARRAGRKDVRELLTLRSQLREAVTHGEPLRSSRLNWRLHQRVMAIAAQRGS